ncbi:MAG: arginine deiminase-related protein [Sediminibacterium sp.]|nr:arginine deiminase-related protein [Sediminibacterium sp.]
MIRPFSFYFNAETAVNNAFQQNIVIEDANKKALMEFDEMVKTLTSKGIEVIVIQDTASPSTPDSIFPNNWISFHKNNEICLYPMFAANRRLERKPAVLNYFTNNYTINKIIDLTYFEEKNIFLEGTGSMVFDRKNQLVYACVSERMNITVLKEWCTIFNYTYITFLASDNNNFPIYHTNVLMCVADKFVVICLDCIKNNTEKMGVKNAILNADKTIIEISMEQMNMFAGNMLELNASDGKSYLIMSQSAYNSLNEIQINLIGKYSNIVAIPLFTIEKLGGGSARCMMAEVFLN